MERVFVLRKSFGPYSAGTRVEYDNKYQEYVIGKFDDTLIVPADLVTQRRQRSMMVPIKKES
jgi:hypothetical protein